MILLSFLYFSPRTSYSSSQFDQTYDPGSNYPIEAPDNEVTQGVTEHPSQIPQVNSSQASHIGQVSLRPEIPDHFTHDINMSGNVEVGATVGANEETLGRMDDISQNWAGTNHSIDGLAQRWDTTLEKSDEVTRQWGDTNSQVRQLTNPLNVALLSASAATGFVIAAFWIKSTKNPKLGSFGVPTSTPRSR